jgi:hypothetical protein
MGFAISLSAGLGAIVVFVCILSLAYNLLNFKAGVDDRQMQAAEASGVATQMGMKPFAIFLRAAAAGSIRNLRKSLKHFWKQYCQGEDGPKRLARDVVRDAYGFIRNDPKYGNEVRREVFYDVLGITPEVKKNLHFAEAGARLKNIHWEKSAAMAIAAAEDDFFALGDALRSLVQEAMEPKGEKKIAARVAKQTLEVLWTDPDFHDAAEAIIREYHQRAEDEEVAEIEAAKKMLARKELELKVLQETAAAN